MGSLWSGKRRAEAKELASAAFQSDRFRSTLEHGIPANVFAAAAELPVLKEVLCFWEMGFISWEKALQAAVVFLATEVERLKACEQKDLPPMARAWEDVCRERASRAEPGDGVHANPITWGSTRVWRDEAAPGGGTAAGQVPLGHGTVIGGACPCPDLLNGHQPGCPMAKGPKP